jgi:CheY-like chemotaxis protein
MEYIDNVPERVVGDEARIRQVLVNLVSNAVKFTHAGAVLILVGGKPLADGRFRFRLAVQDTGIGIPREKLDLIFDRFTQADSSSSRQYGGTGLGLPITRHLVGLMGGDMTATSEQGMGSLFQVELELELQAPSPSAPLPARTLRDEPLRGRVLLVEDNFVNQRVAQKMLEKMGLEVVVRENGLEAVDEVEGGSFDAILMDCQMPVMDGYAATREIRRRELAQGTPIIALTANAMADDQRRCLEAGMDGFVPKPVSYHQLRESLVKWNRPATRA